MGIFKVKKNKNREMQSNMKKEMKKIMTALNPELFEKYWLDYAERLETANETEFIEYLQK